MKTLFTNAILFGCPYSDSLLVSSGRILRIGKFKELRCQADKVFDLNGGFLCPAFIDGHVHPVSAGMTMLSLDLRDVSSNKEFIKRISAYASTLKPDEWVKGRNWQADFWPDGHPDKESLDKAVGGRPALIYRFDGHVAVASSKALELAGINENTPDPSGGIIGRDESGKPDGILKDEAIILVKQKMNLLTVQELEKIFEIVSDEASSLGIGTLHSVISLREFNILRTLSERKRLKCRFTCYAVPGDGDFDEFLDNAADLKHQCIGDYNVRLLGVKFFYDGALGSKTALFQEPYLDAINGKPGNCGIRCSGDRKMFGEKISKTVAKGLQPMVHAIGELAVREVIDVYSGIDEVSRIRLRPRIEHVQHVIPEDIKRIAELGLIASVQPRHIFYDGALCGKILGPVREKNTYVFRTMLSFGVKMCFGSDWPVVELNPLLGIYSAVSRAVKHMEAGKSWLPEQKISVSEAISLFTEGASFAEFAENEKGSIKENQLADLVLLSKDPRECELAEIPEIKVLKTDMYIT
jgi:hypothetical protein